MDVHKVRSTPDDPSRAIVQGIAEHPRARGPYRPRGPASRRRARLHRRDQRGARAPRARAWRWSTTAGFEDVLRIGRQTRRELYNFFVEDRRPLVDPALTFGVSRAARRRRRGARGARRGERSTAREPRCVEAGVEAVAVCLLHSYANPEHERRVAARLRARRSQRVRLASRCCRSIANTSAGARRVVNAYVTPLMVALPRARSRRSCRERA